MFTRGYTIIYPIKTLATSTGPEDLPLPKVTPWQGDLPLAGGKPASGVG